MATIVQRARARQAFHLQRAHFSRRAQLRRGARASSRASICTARLRELYRSRAREHIVLGLRGQAARPRLFNEFPGRRGPPRASHVSRAPGPSRSFPRRGAGSAFPMLITRRKARVVMRRSLARWVFFSLSKILLDFFVFGSRRALPLACSLGVVWGRACLKEN